MNLFGILAAKNKFINNDVVYFVFQNKMQRDNLMTSSIAIQRDCGKLFKLTEDYKVCGINGI